MAVAHDHFEQLVQHYWQALKECDVERCVSCYAADGTIHYMMAVYEGAAAIKEWHEDRFQANFQIISIDRITVQANRVRLDLTFTSDRLKAWHVKTLSVKSTLLFIGDKIADITFSLSVVNAFEGYW